MSISFVEDWFNLKTKNLWKRHLLIPRKPIRYDLDGHNGTHVVVESEKGPLWTPGESTYLEIGVAEGHSMRWVLENLRPKFALGLDPWEPPREKQRKAFEQYVANVHLNLAEFIESGQLELHRTTSQKWLFANLLKEEPLKFDLVYVDGDHHGPEALMDLLLAFQVTYAGGRIILDDLQRNVHRNRPLVYPAAQAFHAIMKERIKRVWEEGRQICWERLPSKTEPMREDAE